MPSDSKQTNEVQEVHPTRRPTSLENVEDVVSPDTSNVSVKMQKVREAYEAYADSEGKPTKGEVIGWCFYGFCSYFIHTVLVPILFSLIVAHTLHLPPQPLSGWNRSYKGFECQQKEMQLYERLIHRSIKISNNVHISPLQWTSFSWIFGLILAAPILSLLALQLDYGLNPQLVAGMATAAGAIFCLPAGFFNTRWIFVPYIAAVVVASTIGMAFQVRHLGLMIHGFVGSAKGFSKRRAIGGKLSLYSTAAGSLGAAIVSAFVFYMLRKADSFTSLWVVLIFSGLIWLTGTVQILGAKRQSSSTSSTPASVSHVVSIFRYPHAAGSLVGVFLSSFTTMCIFTAALLYSTGDLCIEEHNLLYLWLLYFLFPLLSLPLSHQLQLILRADAVKMQLLGFLLCALTSGFGFYFHNHNWQTAHLLVFAAVHATATGILYSFGRVLTMDCSPKGKEGTFSVWFSWVKTLGTCAGFAFASAIPRYMNWSFGVAFWSAILGTVVLIFGNIDNIKGAKAAGNVINYIEEGSSVVGFESGGMQEKGSSKEEAPTKEKIEV